jgi:ABC-type branched-subunit amino acid transport system ATPase component
MVSKTTTVRSIIGLTPASAAANSVRGYGHLPPCRIARHRIGLVPEGRHVAPIEIASRHYVIERPHQLERSVA